MKKEFLLELGISEENAKKIMEQNGIDIDAVDQKLRDARQERDDAQNLLKDAQEQLQSFEGVDVKDLQQKVNTLTADLQAKDTAYAAAIAERDRKAETAAFIAALPQKFVNAETAEYYAGKINEALTDAKSEGKSRADLLKELTAGEDGQAKAGIFEAEETPNKLLDLPPAGGAPDKGSGFSSLKDSQTKLNEHRLVRP